MGSDTNIGRAERARGVPPVRLALSYPPPLWSTSSPVFALISLISSPPLGFPLPRHLVHRPLLKIFTLAQTTYRAYSMPWVEKLQHSHSAPHIVRPGSPEPQPRLGKPTKTFQNLQNHGANPWLPYDPRITLFRSPHLALCRSRYNDISGS